MNDAMDESNRLSCADAGLLLEKQISEEALDALERAALEAHLASCPKCRRLVNWVTALPKVAVELSDAEIRSAYLSAKSRKEHLAHSRSHTQTVRAAVAAIAAAAAIVALILGAKQVKRILSDDESPAIAARECLPASPEEPAPGVALTYCEGLEPVALVENGGEVRVLLKEGAAAMQIDPNRYPKSKVTVETAQGEVRVKGTVFAVQVNPDETRLEVFRGVVEFVPAGSGESSLEVKAGKGADLRRRAVFPLVSPRTEALRRTLEERVDWKTARAEAAPASGGSYSTNAKNPSEAGRVTEIFEPRGPKVPSDSPRQVDVNGKSETDAPSRRSVVPSVDALIQDAQSRLIDKDWNGAAARYRDILKHYPGRPESTAALVSLAKIELRRLHRPKEALEHYQTYRKQAPNGPMAEEALFGIAETYRRLGQTDPEAETLRLFIEQYPKSSQIERARARLHQVSQDR